MAVEGISSKDMKGLLEGLENEANAVTLEDAQRKLQTQKTNAAASAFKDARGVMDKT